MSGKYLLMLKNQIRFDATAYANQSIKEESITEWIEILSKGHRTIPMQVTKSDVDLQDRYINLDEATEILNDSLFKFEMINAREYEYESYDLINISIEMNLD